MTVGKAIYNLLVSNADLRAIVDTRIFPEVAQQDAVLPYVVYNVSSNEPSDTKREPSKLDTAQIEVNLYSTSYTECIDMATHTRAALDRVTGTYSGVNVQSIQYLGEIIDFDEAQRTYNITADYDVRISRTDFEIAQGSPITGVTLGELSDVDTTGVTDGQVIAYDAAAQEWQPADDAGGVTELGQLTDVQFGQGGPETGELLKYDGSEWTNDSIVKSEIGLGNVDNTSDANKPVSTATQTALNAKANSADFSNVDNTSDADKPVSTATQTALNAKADTSAVPTDLNDLSDVTIVGTPVGNQALIYDATAGAFKSQVSYTNRFEDEVETGLQMPSVYFERGYSVKSEGDGIFIDPSPDTPTAGKVIVRKIYHKTGFISDADVIGDYTLIHTFADDTAYSDTVATFDGFEDGATYGVPPFTLAQTWEEVTAAPAFTGLLNETYGSGAEAAYSTRRLNGNVTDCMVIRRASDSTTTTIGFDSEGNISEADIISFCTGTTCTVYQWLDQSGNGNTATAPSTGEEPTIYTGGALVKENGRVAVDFDGTGDFLQKASPTGFSGKSQSSFNIVANDSVTIDAKFFYSLGDVTVSTGQLRSITQEPYLRFQATTQDYNSYHTSGNQELYSLVCPSATTINDYDLYRDGSLLTPDSLSGGTIADINASFLTIGFLQGASTANTFNGKQQELILYNSDKSSDRTSIESNIGNYFTQNTPLLDTYTGAAAAYSLRLLDSTYTGALVEVYNGSSYADIGANVFGELNTVALADHCGSNDGFVSKWYSQTGSNDAVQTNTANMPKIYDGTTGVVTENGKPALDFDGSNDFFNTSLSQGTLTEFLYTGVAAPTTTTALQSLIDLRDANDDGTRVLFVNNGTIFTSTDAADSSTTYAAAQQLVTGEYDGTNLTTYVDGTGGTSVSGTDTTATANALIGVQLGASSFFMNGTMQELVLYFSDQSANRTNIESNIATFYDITI